MEGDGTVGEELLHFRLHPRHNESLRVTWPHRHRDGKIVSTRQSAHADKVVLLEEGAHLKLVGLRAAPLHAARQADGGEHQNPVQPRVDVDLHIGSA